MAKEPHSRIDVERLDPAMREEAALGAATSDFEGSEDITIVDPKTSAFQAMHEQDRIFKEEQERNRVDVTTERAAAPITAQPEMVRNRARILYVIRDSAILTESSEIRKKTQQLAQLFAEVHVLLLTVGRDVPTISSSARRFSENIWLYSAHTRFRFGIVSAAQKIAKTELTFGAGFRPDIVIADDPFESGLVGQNIAKTYGCPFQVHVHDDFFDPAFTRTESLNTWRRRVAHKILRNGPCVRTESSYIKSRLLEEFSILKDKVDLLPVFYNVRAWGNEEVKLNVQKKYPQFKFIICHIAYEHEEKNSVAVIDGLFYLLRQYPTIGLVIVGSIGVVSRLEERAAAYHLNQQIVFETEYTNVLSYIKTSHVVIYTSDEPAHNEVVLMSAALGVPLISSNTGLAAELFIDEESVLLCPVDSPPCFGEKINRLLNDNPLRRKLALNAREIVDKDIEQDYDTYLTQYRAGIESCLVLQTEPS